MTEIGGVWCKQRKRGLPILAGLILDPLLPSRYLAVGLL
jgi:hypothetical protein